MSDAPAVIGASDHIGWAELVTLAARGGAPVLLDRRRVALVGEGVASAPYHHEAPGLDLAAARTLVDRTRRSVAEHARAALSTLASLHRARAIVLQASPYERLPGSLEDVLASRALTCAADGMTYREALADAARDLGLDVVRYPRRTDTIAWAAETLRVDPSEIAALVLDLGRAVGPPWRKEHRLAAAAALRVLAPSIRCAPGGPRRPRAGKHPE